MRLAFLCSGLERGRDGVGDFTRTLAAACAAAGHETRLAAVRDPHCRKEAPAIVAAFSGERRFQDIFCQPEEAGNLQAWLGDFKPDWVSVQYTPFGFHPRGLGAGRAAWLRALMPPGARRHLMLHEIWLQPGRGGAWRHRALGLLQRGSVDAWTQAGWKPSVTQTQARLHRERLQARKVKVDLLPLFTTFARPATTPQSARVTVSKWLENAGLPLALENEAALWIGHFGTLHNQQWNFGKFAESISSRVAQTGKRVCFLALGRGQTVATAWAEAARAVPGAEFRQLGELSEEKVSPAMNACDAAFTTTPWDIIEKSSAVAAWRAAGVPVLVTRAGATNPGKLPPWPDPGLLLIEDKNSALPKSFERIPGPAFLEPADAARTFLSTLAAAPADHL